MCVLYCVYKVYEQYQVRYTKAKDLHRNVKRMKQHAWRDSASTLPEPADKIRVEQDSPPESTADLTVLSKTDTIQNRQEHR